jgi:hypothetical protein
MARISSAESIPEIGKKIARRAAELCFLRLATGTTGYGSMISHMDRVAWSTPTVMYMKACGRWENVVDTVFLQKDAETTSRDIGLMICE